MLLGANGLGHVKRSAKALPFTPLRHETLQLLHSSTRRAYPELDGFCHLASELMTRDHYSVIYYMTQMGELVEEGVTAVPQFLIAILSARALRDSSA